MSIFIKQIIKFSILLLILFLLFFMNNKIILNKMYDHGNFYLNEDVETLILGDSHTMTSINPKYLKKSINLSNNNEMYVFTYNKLKLLITKKTSIKNIIIGFSYHNTSNRYDYLRDEQYLDLLDSYFPILDDSTIHHFSAHRTPYLKNYYKYKYGVSFSFKILEMEFKYLLNKLSKNDYPFWGGYYLSLNSNLSKSLIDKKVYEYYYSNNQVLEISKYQIKYLKKILSFCANNNIRVIIYNSPIFSEHFTQIPNIFLESYNSIIKELLQSYNNLEYIDFSAIVLPYNHYGDGDHLNDIGAKWMTIEIDSLLSN